MRSKCISTTFLILSVSSITTYTTTTQITAPIPQTLPPPQSRYPPHPTSPQLPLRKSHPKNLQSRTTSLCRVLTTLREILPLPPPSSRAMTRIQQQAHVRTPVCPVSCAATVIRMPSPSLLALPTNVLLLAPLPRPTPARFRSGVVLQKAAPPHLCRNPRQDGAAWTLMSRIPPPSLRAARHPPQPSIRSHHFPRPHKHISPRNMVNGAESLDQARAALSG